MKKFLFCIMVLSVHNIFGENNEVTLGFNQSEFPFYAGGDKRSDICLNRNSWNSVSSVGSFDFNPFVMANIITSYNNDSAGKSFQEGLLPLYIKNCQRSKSYTEAFEFTIENKLCTDFKSDSHVASLMAVFFNNSITLASVGKFVALLCRQNEIIPLMANISRETSDDHEADFFQIKEISMNTYDKFLILATPEISQLSLKLILKLTNVYMSPKDICEKIIQNVLMCNKKHEDFSCIVIKLVQPESSVYRKNLRALSDSMQQLLEDNKNKLVPCASFCQLYKKICQKLLMFMGVGCCSKLDYQTNDLFYEVIRDCFLIYCEAKNLYLWLDDDLGAAFKKYHEVLSFIVNNSYVRMYFSPKQQADIKFWAQKVKLYFDWEDKTMLLGAKNPDSLQNNWAAFGEKQKNFSLENI